MTTATHQPYRFNTSNGDYPLGVKLASAGLAACCADLITFPLDTAKVRLQIQNTTPAIGSLAKVSKTLDGKNLIVRKQGLFGTLYKICVSEGPVGLYSGLSAGLQRQLVFSSIRIGLYEDVKCKYQRLFGRDTKTKHQIDVRILAGLTTGAISVSVGQPTDVVKIRMQAQGASGTRLYSGAIQAYRQIAMTEGVRGLWRGYVPNVVRNSLTSVGELVTYDVIKEYIIRHNILRDNVGCHMLSGLTAGFFATLIASPVDVVKTRYMTSQPGQFAGVLDCAMRMIRANGPTSLYKGFVPSFIRFGSWNIVTFVCYEQAKQIFSSCYRTERIPNKGGGVTTDHI